MATTEVGNVIFRISADIRDIQGQVRQLDRNFQTSFGRIEGMARNLGRVLSSAFGVTLGISGLVAAGAGLLNLARNAARFADEIGKAAQATGTTTEFLSAMRHGANLADVSFQELTNGLSRFSRVVSDATHGLSTAVRPFQTLGIAIKDNNGVLKTSEQLIVEVADAFQKLPDGVTKSAVAQELFGRSGTKLIPLLNQGRDGIEAFTAEAQKLGIIVSTEAAKAAEEFNDNMTRLGAAAEGLKIKIGNDLIPVLIRLLDLFGKLAGVKLAGVETRALEDSIALIDKQIASLEEQLARPRTPLTLRDHMVAEIRLQGLLRDRLDLEEQLQKLTAEPPKPTEGGGAKAIIDDKAIKKSARDVKGFFDSLQKQLDQTRDKVTQGVFGDDVALTVQLNRTFRQFKEGFEAEFPGIKLPADFSRRFEALKEQIIAVQQELRVATFEAERLDEAAKRDSQDSAEWLQFAEDLGKLGLEAQEAAKEMERLATAERLAVLDIADAEQGQVIADQVQKVQDLGQALSDLRDQQREAEALSAALGDQFDSTSAQIDIQRQRIEELTRALSDPNLAESIPNLAEKLQEAAERFNDLTAERDLLRIFRNITDAIGRGIEDTIRGISEGSQTLSEGLNNLLRNVFLNVNVEIIRAAIVQPITDIVNAFFEGFAKAFSEAGDNFAEKLARDLGSKLGEALRSALGGVNVGGGGNQQPNIGNFANVAAPAALAMPIDFQAWTFEIQQGSQLVNNSMTDFISGLGTDLSNGFASLADGLSDIIGNIFSGISSGASSFLGFLGFLEKGGSVRAFDKGGPVAFNTGVRKSLPHFAEGGSVPIIAHEGEFVVKASSVRKVGQSTLEHINEKGELPQFRYGGFVVPSFQIGGAVTGLPQVGRAEPTSANGKLNIASEVLIRGGIVPEPGVDPEQVVSIVFRNLDNRGELMQVIEQRTVRGSAV